MATTFSVPRFLLFLAQGRLELYKSIDNKKLYDLSAEVIACGLKGVPFDE